VSFSSGDPDFLDEIQACWISCHLYYHQDLDEVLAKFVQPAIVDLVKKNQIQAFFFVRYGLGGPHVRLRVKALPDFRNRVLKEVQRFAEDFLRRTPSTRPMEESVISKINEAIISSDPNETDGSIYPDNSFRAVPFRPEIQRYGGPRLFQASLDFFTLSSVAAVNFLSKYGHSLRSVQLAHAFRLLLHQALGFAAGVAELSDLLRYGVDSLGEGRQKAIEKGDKVAQAQMSTVLQLFRQSIDKVHLLLAEGKSFYGASDFLIGGADRLSAATVTADRVTRARIGGSQLHMTASRLGLSNVEEVYISRLLTVTLHEVLAASIESFSWLENRMVERAVGAPSCKALQDLLVPALATLAGEPSNKSTL
jgi:hypothetical protein